MALLDAYEQQPDQTTALKNKLVIQGLDDVATQRAKAQQDLTVQADQNARAQAEAERQAAENKRQIDARAASSEFASGWATDPNTAGKGFNQLDPYTQQRIITEHPGVTNAPALFNEAQAAASGNPNVGVDAPRGSHVTSKQIPGLDVISQPGGNMQLRQKLASIGGKAEPDATDDELMTALADRQEELRQAEINKVPSDLKSELGRLNAWKDGMTLDQAQQARDEAYMKSGVIPERYQKPAETLAAQIVKHPILAPFAKQKEAYDTMKSGFENPQAGGFGDMAMIEGFQRIVNPGAVVRQQTMNQMLAAAGLSQYGSWEFLKNKLSQGDKLSPEARTRLMNLAEETFKKAQGTAARELAAKQRYARSLGIPQPEQFVNNVLDYVAQSGEPAPAAPAPAGTAPAPTAGVPAGPKVGEVQKGYRFKGGNPADRNSWEPAQ